MQGVKWSSTKWIHVASLLDGEAAGADADAGTGCIDSEKGCEDWAWADECERSLNCRAEASLCRTAAWPTIELCSASICQMAKY